jgi:ABC-type multidrug transport system fused ATPase/permease subunit
MIKLDNQTKVLFFTCLIGWGITFGTAWNTFSNTVVSLETNQQMLTENTKDLTESLISLSKQVYLNSTNAAVSNSLINRLDVTLNKLDSTLDNIVKETTINSIRLDTLER